MQIALPGSLHRVIVWLCSSVHSLTVEARRVAVHSLTAVNHSRGTRCSEPCRAHCIVSLGAQFQLSTACVQSAPVCQSPASGAVT